VGRVQDKVAFITGAARGQGRSHAVRLAQEGADIIAVDLCHDIETVKYSLAGPGDLKETVRLVEALDRRIVAVQADVRERGQLSAALEQGIAELGRLDIVVAQAGIAPMKGDPPLQAWTDVIDTNLIGTINAIQVALPHLGEGASVIATGSTAAYVNALPIQQAGNGSGRHGVHGGQADAVGIHPRAGPQPGPAKDPGQRRPPRQREHGHAAQRADVPGFLPGPGAPDPPGRGAGVPGAAGHADPLRRAGGHQQRGAVPGLGRGPLHHRHAAARGRRRATSSGTTSISERPQAPAPPP